MEWKPYSSCVKIGLWDLAEAICINTRIALGVKLESMYDNYIKSDWIFSNIIVRAPIEHSLSVIHVYSDVCASTNVTTPLI